MARSITIKEDSLNAIRESMVGSSNTASHNTVCVMEARPEVDEFELCQETDNPPLGGNYCHTEGNSVNESSVPREFIERALKLRPDKFSNWVVIDLVDINRMPRYFQKKSAAYSYYKWLRNTDKNAYKPIIINLDKEITPINENKYDVISLAIERYGLTNNLNQAGYILPNGSLLNFGRNGYREEDHRGIEGIYKSNNIDIWSDEYRYNYVVDFMNHGAIRCCLNGGILDMTKEPTAQQYSVIKAFVRRAVDIDIDFTDDKGNTLHSASYTDAKPSQVVGDIYRYYNDGIKPIGNVQYESKDYSLAENIDFEVNSSDIDLSSFKKKNSLAPIWNEQGELNPRIRLKLLGIADDFWKFVNLTWVKPRGIILTGSICNYNWSHYSDVDLHLVVDFNEIDEKTEFVRDYLDAKKNEWNNEHENLQIMGYPVELYVQNIDEMPQSGGIYDLEENDWIKKPNADDIKSIGLNKFSIKDKAANIMTIIDDIYDALNSTSDSHEIEQIGDDAKYLWKKVKDMRKKSLATSGENGSGNIVYKILRRTNYLEKLWKLSTIVYDRNNSITESKEIIKEYLEKDNNLPLYKYFQWFQNAGEREKLEDLMHDNSYVLSEYINNMARQYDEFEPYRMELVKNEDVVYNEEFIDGVVDTVIQLGLYNAYECFFRNKVDYYDWPTWLEMDFIRIVKNEWCIHFTEYADDISKEGFTSGTEDISRLAFTGAGQQKPSAGYDFAFLINDRNVDFNNYGTKAVIFRTSGVLVRHYGDEQDQVIFWGPNVKSFIPVENDGDWIVYGQKGQVLFRGEKPSDVAFWATNNLPQYRKQIMTGKNGYIPKQAIYDPKTYKVTHKPYPIYRNESVQKYLTLLKENMINEEWVADGNANHNPYAKRWKAERQALKDFICNYGALMQSKENGKIYKCYYDQTLSQLIGYNYCICIQYDTVEMKPKSVLYIRALDKFTPTIRKVPNDMRGHDNLQGTYDDLNYRNY